MNTRFVKYNDLLLSLRFQYCKSMEKAMEAIGRTREYWTVQDILDIDDDRIRDSDKLWVIKKNRLVKKKHIKKVFLSLIEGELSSIYASFKKEGDDATADIIDKFITFVGVDYHIGLFKMFMTKSGPDLKSQMSQLSLQMAIYSDRLINIIRILRRPINIGLAVIDDKIDIDCVCKYLNMLKVIVSGAKTATETPVWELFDVLEDLRYGGGEDSPRVFSSTRILNAITAVQKKSKQPTDVKENKQ